MTTSRSPHDVRAADPVRLLLIEDQPGDAFLVEDTLVSPSSPRWAEITHAGSLEDSERVLADSAVDCVLLDLGLPGCSGLDALHRFRARHPELPVVVLTGHNTEASAVASLAAGAQDYVAKQELEARILRRAVSYALERHRIMAQLADSNTRLREFNRVIAHDLKNPLIAILHLAGLLQEYEARGLATNPGMLGRLVGSAEGVIGMIDDLLAYAQADKLTGEKINLDTLLADTLRVLDDQIAEAKATVDVIRPLPVLTGHGVALRHVFRNLLLNALTYRHPERPPLITITADTTGGTCLLIVSDNGVGVPPDARQTIFEAGIRLSPGLAPGHGLGLAAVRSLVERHGGRVWADDNPTGLGIRFCLEFPLEGQKGASPLRG
jgi:signal transduction histidine kinase